MTENRPVQKERSMLLQKEMFANHFKAVEQAPETGKKIVYTFISGNLNELILCFDNLLAVHPGFVDPGRFDYRLLPGSPAIDAGTDPGKPNGTVLAPAFEYFHPMGGVERTPRGAIDIGGHEFNGG